MDSMIIITLFVCFIELTIKIECKTTPVIRTTKGPIQGEVLNTAINSIPYSSFKGVPYAEPPLGYLRYKPPVEKKSWTEVLPTTIEGANCVQNDFVYHMQYTGSEDCLYLNVYTPQLKFTNMGNRLSSVMVWIYGGNFKSGYGNSSLYGPDYIIENNVVLVTFNYRLGPLGFLNLNHENATGNAGLKDQNLVLRWVRDNIRRFGGNPKDVTIFGQSAGGVSVDLHMLSDLSTGLFHRAIAMSGSALCPWAFQAPELAVKNGFELGEKLGKNTTSTDELLKTLYEASALELMQKAEEMGPVNVAFIPTIENKTIAPGEKKFLTQCPYAKYLSKNFSKVPYITGFMANETLLFAESPAAFLEMATLSNGIVQSFPSEHSVSLPATAKAIDSLTNGEKSLSNITVDAVVKETSDVLFIAGIDYQRKFLQSQTGQLVYMYRFAYESDESLHKTLYGIDIKGAAHQDDIGYIFHTTVSKQSMDPKNPSFITRQRMARLWTNFAKYGNPTPTGKKDKWLQGILWPTTIHKHSYLEIENNLSIQHNPADETVTTIEKGEVAILPTLSGCVAESATIKH